MDCGIEWPYEQWRPGQKELAGEIARAVSTGGMISITAPTGFGKTPAVLYGVLCGGAERVLYLVRTVNEVDPVLRELSRLGVEYSFLYSARRMCPLLRGTQMSSEEFWTACRLARLQGLCKYFAELERVEPEDIAEVVAGSGETGSKKIISYLSSALGVCPFFALRKLVDGSRVVVATYPYGFRLDIFNSIFDPYDYSDFVIVVDEAHSLINIHSLYEKRLRKADIEKSIEEIRRYMPTSSVAIELLEELLQRFRLLERTVRGAERLEKSIIGPIISEVDMINTLAEEIMKRRIEEAILSGSGAGDVRTRISRVSSWLVVLSLPDSFLFAEHVNGDLELVATPMDPMVVVKTPLERAAAAVLLSGTLPRGDYVRELFGVERPVSYIDVELIYGFTSFARNTFTVVAKNVTTRYRERSPEMFRAIAVYVTLITRLMPGAKLAVYPSYEVMHSIVGKMPAGIPMVIEDRSTNIADVQDRLVQTPDLLINAVADGKLVEGVEFVIDGKNLLRSVIVVGVPFPQPDIYTRTFKDVLARRVGARRADYYTYLYSAIVKVRQALGRATRSPSDKAAYFLLDRRYLRRDIREHLRVPVRKVVGSPEGMRRAIGEARRFLSG